MAQDAMKRFSFVPLKAHLSLLCVKWEPMANNSVSSRKSQELNVLNEFRGYTLLM